MAALVLRRAGSSSSSPISLATRSAGYSSSLAARSSSLSVFHRHFSTSAASELPSLVNFVLEKSETLPHFRADPSTPIPDGFPFTVINNESTLTLLRQDKDEKINFSVVLKRFHVVDGNPCFLMNGYIDRGYWTLKLEFFAGPKTLIVSTAKLSDISKRNFPCFKEFLESKGINKELVTSLYSFWQSY